MVSKFIYNKSKINTVILIHGLFANSGFWLSYLSYFKEYKIIIYNIDFNSFFSHEDSISSINSEFTHDFVSNSIFCVISHSFGSVLSDLIFSKLDPVLFNICPITIGSRLDTSSFIIHLSTKLNLSEIEICDVLLYADYFQSNVKNKLSYKGINFIPDNDFFFNYNYESQEFVKFQGDHFDIKNAIVFITKKLNF